MQVHIAEFIQFFFMYIGIFSQLRSHFKVKKKIIKAKDKVSAILIQNFLSSFVQKYIPKIHLFCMSIFY